MKGTLRAEVGEGPLRLEYERLLRGALRRGDSDPEAALAGATLTGTYSSVALQRAQAAWRERLHREHHSAAVFSRLLPQLMEAEATLDVKAVVLRMAMDELRHAGLAAAVLGLLGAEPATSVELVTSPLPEHPRCTPQERALRNVLFVGLNETVGVAVLSEERELCSEPAIAAALNQLIGDEVSHARLGWIYLAETWPKLDAGARERTAAYLPHAFRYLEEQLLRPLAGARDDDALRDELNALGLSAPQDQRDLFIAAVEGAVLPPLDEYGMRASEAWRARLHA